MPHGDLALLGRIVLGFALTYAFGFERQLRGSPAGDRTFALVGAASTAIAAVAGPSSPQTVAGVLTGIGFIGGGLVFRGRGGLVRGLTSAAALFAAAGVGIVVGYGHLVLGVILAALMLFVLELPFAPFLRWLDARTYRHRFRDDQAPDPDSGSG
jgi:putative Mg2+ transporter-C (MgtC) family protein